MAEPRSNMEMTQTRSTPSTNGSGAIATEPTEPSGNSGPKLWKSDYCYCCDDEQTCWWGYCYFILLHARTVRIFEVDLSVNQIALYILFFIGLYFLSGILVIVGLVLLVLNRAYLRTAMRRKRNIMGTFCSDFVMHCCCAPCAICQEAREAKIAYPHSIDFITGEDLAIQEESYGRATGHGERGTANQPKEGDKFYNHLRAISNTSKLILGLSLAAACISSFLLIWRGPGSAILVLILIFLQPFLILYFVYWRARREYTSLDYVIKCFAVGYFMTTAQAVGVELLLQNLMSIFLIAVVIVSGPIVNSVPAGGIAAPVGTASLNSPSSSMLVMGMTQLSAVHSALFTSASYPLHGASSPTPGVSLVLQYAYANSHSHYAASAEHSSGIHSARNLATAIKVPPEILAPLQRIIRRYSFVIFLGVFIMAFVIAAGVEETLKHFIVRCCPFTRPLKDPSAVLVYLVAGALGFATFENIQYVFLSGGSGDQMFSESVLISELFVLLLRVLMPIHVICAVLQAIQLSKVATGKQTMSLFRVLFPGILLHGSFDFVLMILGPVSFVYQVADMTLEIVGGVLAVSLTIIGTIYAYKTFKKIEKDYHTGYGVSMDEDEDIPLVFPVLLTPR